MPRHPLLASTYSTPGRRAHGRLGVVPNKEEYKVGGFDARGLEVAAVVTTDYVERARAPIFGTATTKMSGQDVQSLFLALAFVHEVDEEDIVVVLGIHGLNHPWLTKYYGKEYAAAALPCSSHICLHHPHRRQRETDYCQPGGRSTRICSSGKH